MTTFLMELVSSSGLFAPLNARATAPSLTFSLRDWQDDTELQAADPVQHVHRDRDFDFGVGYGNSSGYASDRHYTSDWMPGRFGFV
ncbi:hypothetical protein HIV01_003400 [Lysobacter arenosi]|uniref:Uncharacterized protein n=1 Tax=Lysobacter arenosi TaxID=2795387 RepID=A0ABX7RBQ4_9GAMM|nr:hypothetical protein [Lysobacter arenosi]QSX75590.1 hypothetical protein HIV01_003400 [Lysobacter arenosi]